MPQTSTTLPRDSGLHAASGMPSDAATHAADDAADVAAARARRGAWLRAACVVGGRESRRAAAMLCLDGLGAIGFAGALAGGIVHLPQGLWAAAPWLVLAVAAMALRGACSRWALRFGARAAHRAKSALRRRIVVASLAIPQGERPSVGSLMGAAVDEVEALDGYLTRFLPARHAAALVPFLVLAAAAFASPIAAAILLLTLPPFILALALAGGAAADASRRQFDALSRLSSLFADRVRGLPAVLAFGAEQAEAARLGVAAEGVQRRTLRVLRVAFLSSGALEFFAALSVALVAVYAGFNLLGLLPFHVPEKLDLARAFFVLALAPEFYAPMRRLAAAYHEKQAAETAAERLSALEAQARAPASAHAAITAPPSLRFQQVTVRYPGDDRPALKDFSLAVEAGEIVALLGPSGAGKSTALNLLLGIAPLSKGDVWVDDLQLSEAGNFAPAIAWAGQAPLIVPGSIAGNIALARQDAAEEEIAAVARRVGLAGMRRGLSVVVDERGSGLSGGERCRIGLARALLKPAPILLLDEPTAHLDATSERALIQVIADAARGRTTLIATHSPALAAIAHRVIRLEEAA